VGGRSPLSSCGRRSALLPPVAGFTNHSFYNINIGDLPTTVFHQDVSVADFRCPMSNVYIGRTLPLMSLIGVRALPVHRL